MDVSQDFPGREQEIVEMFSSAFAASEGPGEGALIGGLVGDLLARTPAEDMYVFLAEDFDRIIGAAIFTRLRFSRDPRIVFLLSPMAVAPDCQNQGVGQALLTYALSRLGSRGCDVAMTYGDPEYYRRVDFAPVTEAEAPPPLPLSQPHGWLAQSLDGRPLRPLRGPSTCVAALDRPDIW